MGSIKINIIVYLIKEKVSKELKIVIVYLFRWIL